MLKKKRLLYYGLRSANTFNRKLSVLSTPNNTSLSRISGFWCNKNQTGNVHAYNFCNI